MDVLFRPDSGGYVRAARALLDTGQFSAAVSGIPDALLAPGFPAFLAAVFALDSSNLVATAVVLCLVSALTCVPIFLIAESFGGCRAGGWAAALWAANLTSVAAAPLFLSDSSFTLLVALSLLCTVRYWREQRMRDLLLAAALSALAMLVRVVGGASVAGLVLCALAARGTTRRRAVALAIVSVVVALVIGPWIVRNHRLGAGWRIETNSADMFYYYQAGTMASIVRDQPADSLRARWKAADDAEFAAHPDIYRDEADRIGYKSRKAQAIIRTGPLLFARLQVQPTILLPDAPTLLELLGLTEGERGTLDVLRRRGLVAAVAFYFEGKLWLLALLVPLLGVIALTYVAAAAQALAWWRGGRRLILALWLMMVALYLLAPGPITMPRYQLPALPLLTTMAGLACSALWSRHRSRFRGEPAAGLWRQRRCTSG